MGRGSLSSLLSGLLDVMFYVTGFVLVTTVVLVMAGVNVALRIDADGPAVDAGPHAVMSIPVSLNVDAYRVSSPSLGIDGAQLQNVRGALRFPPRRGPLFAASLGIVFGLLALAMFVLGQLRGLFRTLRAGQPFAPANAARVRRIAWALIVGEVARSAVVFFENSYAASHFAAAALSFDARLHLNPFAIVNGLIILVIGEVFREGTRLDEDRSLTI